MLVCEALNGLLSIIEQSGLATPWFFVGLFVASSFFMIWRLEALSSNGFEGTVLGTLVMPYCSGLGNLFFAFLLGQRGSEGAEVLTNCLVNNVTNLTLLIGLPAVLWGLQVIPSAGKKSRKRRKAPDTAPRLNRLSLLLTMFALLFFTGITWAVASDGRIDFADGLVLVGLFLFWQCIHVFEVLKTNVRQNKSFGLMLWVDLCLLLGGAYVMYVSVEWLVNWLTSMESGFVSAAQIGWLSGWLMVLPNGLLAMYYGWKGRSEVVYSSQFGDGHICVPLCIGLFALFHPIAVPVFFKMSMLILGGAAIMHMACIALMGRLPQWIGGLLVLGYGVFLFLGLV